MIPRNLIITVAVMLVLAVGMAVYGIKMRRRATRIDTAVTGRPVPPPVAGPMEQVTLYVASDNPGVLRAQTARLKLSTGRQERAQDLLRSLIGIYLDKSSGHPLPPGADVREVYLVDPGIAVIDLNAAFADGHRSSVLVEELSIGSMVQTLSANIPGLTRVKFLVDGKTRDTLAGHADISNFYDVADAQQMLAGLQGQ